MIATTPYHASGALVCFSMIPVVSIPMGGPQDSTKSTTPCQVSAQCAGARKVLRSSSVSALAALQVREAACLHGPPVQTETKLGCPELHQNSTKRRCKRHSNSTLQPTISKATPETWFIHILQAFSLVRFRKSA